MALRKDAKTSTYVTCPACATEIRLACTARPPGEFSVACPNCGQRTIHQATEAHDPLPSVARPTILRRLEFSTRERPRVLPTSWLSALVASL
jgi:predicted RNA-binding Zn-ribbon protein involved in translation (DUF1610 family)